MSTPKQVTDTMALIAYTREFSALVAGGVQLRRCFDLLQASTRDPALAAANADLSVRVNQNDETLSEAMRNHPQCFSTTYIAFVHSGEIGGVLDETLADLADWLEQEQASAERFRDRILLARLAAKVLGESRGRPVEGELQSQLEAGRRLQQVASFCRLFERCLSAGVPLKLALTTAAEVLGDQVAAEVRHAVGELKEDDSIASVLATAAPLQPVVSDMARIGEEIGSLPDMLRKAAQFMDAEAAHVLHGGVS